MSVKSRINFLEKLLGLETKPKDKSPCKECAEAKAFKPTSAEESMRVFDQLAHCNICYANAQSSPRSKFVNEKLTREDAERVYRQFKNA